MNFFEAIGKAFILAIMWPFILIGFFLNLIFEGFGIGCEAVEKILGRR